MNYINERERDSSNVRDRCKERVGEEAWSDSTTQASKRGKQVTNGKGKKKNIKKRRSMKV